MARAGCGVPRPRRIGARVARAGGVVHGAGSRRAGVARSLATIPVSCFLSGWAMCAMAPMQMWRLSVGNTHHKSQLAKGAFMISSPEGGRSRVFWGVGRRMNSSSPPRLTETAP
eukprot:4541646-Prymnesium_polylepis.1